MTDKYIRVADEENEEPIETAIEDDNTVLLQTLNSLFGSSVTGLKYRNEESGSMRGLRLIDGKLQPPEQGWSSASVYFCCFPKENKRKQIEDQADTTNTKTKRVEEGEKGGRKCSDLIVLGLAWKTTDKELREYFEQFGELLMAQVKKNPKSGQSKGFGFIRFSDYENQVKAVSKRHFIDGRFCDVRIPMSKDGIPGETRNPNQEFNRKIFIGRITSEITADDLKAYFSKYGEISDVFIPKPFRGFAFVTFSETNATQTLNYGDGHIINGISVHVSQAIAKIEMNASRLPADPVASYSNNGNKHFARSSWSTSAYSSYSNNNHPNHLSSPMSPGHPSNYSPSYSPPAPPQYAPDYYRRSSQPQSYQDAGNPYHRPYGSHFNSSDYSPYY